jgi:alpha-tubulin suppressor-like RCC1 family protein
MYSCALNGSGELHCWGWNCDGQLGRFGGPANDHVPQVVSLAPPMERMALGHGFMCGLTADGEVWCWGLNTLGQLGSAAEFENRSVDPVRVSGDLPFTSVSAGFRSACALTSDGAPYCWGQRSYLGAGLPRAAGAPAASAVASLWNPEGTNGPPLQAGASCR